MKGRIPIISEDLGITNLFPGLPDDNPRKYLSSINIVFNQYPEIIKTLVYIIIYLIVVYMKVEKEK